MKPFRYLKLNGGNVCSVIYEPASKASVRVWEDWPDYKQGVLAVDLSRDTLFVNFPDQMFHNVYERGWMKNQVLLRIFSPQLLGVDGFDTNFEMEKFNAQQLDLHLSGRSQMEVESINPQLQQLKISESDSSGVFFEMSPEYPGSKTFSVQRVKAELRGNSWLGMGHAQIANLQADIEDSAAIELSGSTLRSVKADSASKSGVSRVFLPSQVAGR